MRRARGGLPRRRLSDGWVGVLVFGLGGGLIGAVGGQANERGGRRGGGTHHAVGSPAATVREVTTIVLGMQRRLHPTLSELRPRDCSGAQQKRWHISGVDMVARLCWSREAPRLQWCSTV